MTSASGSMAGMDHSKMGQGGGSMAGMGHSKMSMPGMDHSAMGQGAAPATQAPSGKRAFGWADASTPPGAKALSYADLRSATKNTDGREPNQEIVVRLTGIMDRYVWNLNGRPFGKEEPIRVTYGDRVRIKFVNETMMAHPMHLHGMFVELENGQTDRKPLKHVVVVPPGQSVSAVLTANEPGDWPFHCHLVYHMAAGMMTRFIVEKKIASN